MNNKQAFEKAFEERMADLPLPPEEESWQKMKALLDDEDRRKPFAWFKNYKLWTLLVLLLAGGALWFILQPGNPSNLPKQISSTDKTSSSAYSTESKLFKTDTASTSNIQSAIPGTNASETSVQNTNKNARDNDQLDARNKVITKEKFSHSPINSPITKSINPNKNKSKQPSEGKNETKAPALSVTDIKSAISSFKTDNTPIADTLTSDKKIEEFVNATEKKDAPVTISIIKNDSSAKKENTIVSETAKNKTSSNKYIVTAGIGFQQPIPVGGQQTIPLGYNGKSKISDYIPSLYLRIERNTKWFLQAEFNYGAPQLVKEFAYSRKTIADNTTGNINTTTLKLQKTFYNELPISFNYYIRPNWSLGAGAMYSWFHGAIVQKETKRFDLQTQQNTIFTEVLPIKSFTDSFLYRSHTYLLLQSDYQWKRFTFGLRYTKDMQPYIKYTMPDGVIADKRNWSLEFILRFRLFKF